MTQHHEELLVQAAGVTELEGSLESVRGGLGELDTSLEKSVPSLPHFIAKVDLLQVTIKDSDSVSSTQKSCLETQSPSASVRNPEKDVPFCDPHEEIGTTVSRNGQSRGDGGLESIRKQTG